MAPSLAPPRSASGARPEVEDDAAAAGAPLVLDYRDPWTDLARRVPHPGLDLDRHTRAEERCLAAASAVVAVTDTLAGWLAGRGAVAPVVITNAFEPRERPVDLRTGPARLVYAGSLAYDRSLQPLLEALVRLRQRGGRR